MKLLQKTTITAAALILSGSAFADTSTTPSTTKKQLNAGYTAAAETHLNRAWDAYVTANFIYWEALQDNMELGVVSPPTTSAVTIDGSVINSNAGYKPGFQVGLGFGSNYDGWNTEIEYTWFHSNQHTQKTLGSSSTSVIFPLWLSPQGNTFQSASEKWKLELNALDWVLERTSLIGKKLLIKPFFGLRAAWIDQKADVDYLLAATDTTVFYKGKSNSWAIGPEIGLSSRWLLGKGFKLYGDLETDILYTRYTSLDSQEGRELSTGETTIRRDIRQHNLSLLRPHCDLELGLSWGCYFGCRDFHLDLSLGYGFQVFWDQNMFRHFADDVEKASSFSSSGNLYIQGLTASVRFDF